MGHTALKKYQRLETTGLWREAAHLPAREVVISLGEVSLTLTDLAENRVLSHWSLSALERLNEGQMPAHYAPGRETLEILEIDDDLMVGALEKICAALDPDDQKPKLRIKLLGMIAVGAILVGAVKFVPVALIQNTADMMPQAVQIDVGRMILKDFEQTGRKKCDGSYGQAALDRLALRLFPAHPPKMAVLAGGDGNITMLPGQILLIDQKIIDRSPDVEIFSGHLLAYHAAMTNAPTLRDALSYAGLWESLRLMTRGRLAEDGVKGYAHILTQQKPPSVADDVLLAAFRQANVPSTPYAQAVKPNGRFVQLLIDADPMAGKPAHTIMPAQDWHYVKTVCASVR